MSGRCSLLLTLIALRVLAGVTDLPAQLAKRSIAKLAFAEGVVVVNARSDGRVEVGGGSGSRLVALVLEAGAARAWADSVAKILARTGRARRGKESVYRAFVDEPEANGGGLSFTRRFRGRTSVYRLFFADRNYGGFPIGITRTEARALVSAFHAAAAAAKKPMPARRRAGGARVGAMPAPRQARASAAPWWRCSAAAHFAHQREHVVIDVTEERHPQVVIG